MRNPLLALAGIAGATVALAVPAAVADNQAVKATFANTFTPKLTAVKPGESVTITNSGGDHNVVWNDGGLPPTPSDAVPPDQWPASGVVRTFTKPGKYRYFCVLHGDRSQDVGMYGYVYVNSAGLLPPIVSRLSASGNTKGYTVKFTASRAGRAKATLLRKSGRRFVRVTSTTFSARQGANSKHVRRSLSKARYKVEVVLTDANRLASDKRSASFSVR